MAGAVAGAGRNEGVAAVEETGEVMVQVEGRGRMAGPPARGRESVGRAEERVRMRVVGRRWWWRDGRMVVTSWKGVRT